MSTEQPPQGPNDPQQPPAPDAPPPQYGEPPAAPQYGAAPPAPEYGQAPGYGAAPQPPAYGQMPAGPGGPYAPAGPVTAPASITQAVLLMKVGAGLSLVGLILSFLTMGNVKDQVTKKLEEQGTQVDQSTIDAAASIGIGFAIVFGLLGVGLWYWMAVKNGQGRKWARIVATVFFGIAVLSTLSNLAQRSTPALSLVLSVISLVLGAYIIFLLYKKESTAFYEASSAAKQF